MNQNQKQIIQQQLNDEKAILNELKKTYKTAIDDIDQKISDLMARTDTENIQSIIYQVDYQKALKKQVSGILDDLNTKQFNSISEYLATCYETGYIGTMYDLQGQGIPIITPINQEQITKAIVHDTKLKESLYNTLGYNVSDLKKQISSEISRGLSTALSYADIARNVSNRAGVTMNQSIRITRTEGHRITQQASYNAQKKAIDEGADIVKQWDATLDKRTRKSHARVDGQIRELKESFSNGLMFPGDPKGSAGEVINCRCALLQRAKWALDEEELEELKERAKYYGLDKTKNFEEYKQKYIAAQPDVLEIVDYSNKKLVESTLKKYEKEIVKSNVENAVVITKNGIVYKIAGEKRNVYPERILGTLLKGGSVTHNHPLSYTEYSFSNDDINLFNDYNLELLRGIDNKFTYELTKLSDDVPHDYIEIIVDLPEDSCRHNEVIRWAKENNIGYERKALK